MGHFDVAPLKHLMILAFVKETYMREYFIVRVLKIVGSLMFLINYSGWVCSQLNLIVGILTTQIVIIAMLLFESLVH